MYQDHRSAHTGRFKHYLFSIEMVDDGWATPDCYSKDFKPLPKDPGVYLFALTKVSGREGSLYPRIAYVGQSTNLFRRLSNHPIEDEIRSKEDFSWSDDGAWLILQRWFKPFPKKLLTPIEVSLIKKYDPPYNVQHRARRICFHG
jgi:excinuclease UvrABC nuclease subunit